MIERKWIMHNMWLSNFLPQKIRTCSLLWKLHRIIFAFMLHILLEGWHIIDSYVNMKNMFNNEEIFVFFYLIFKRPLKIRKNISSYLYEQIVSFIWLEMSLMLLSTHMLYLRINLKLCLQIMDNLLIILPNLPIN